jgi:dimethylamine corrinoid protein
MSDQTESLFQALSDAVVGMDEDLTRQLSKQAVEQGIDALATIEHGLVEGMNRAGKLFETEEYFIPELLLCSDAMYAGPGHFAPASEAREKPNSPQDHHWRG